MTVAAAPSLPEDRRAHIVDALIEERAPRLSASPAWPALRPVLHAFLGYAKARRMADAIRPLSGEAALDYVSALLSLEVSVSGLQRVPTTGRVVVVCNHPTGIADGIAVRDALLRVRRDLVFYANVDALRVAPRFVEALIPVEWREERRTLQGARDILLRTRRSLAAEQALVIFPAGRLARRRPDGRLADPPWATSAVTVARCCGAPVLPIHVAGPSSSLFHLFHRFSSELRDITLFHELLNKQGRAFHLTVGQPIAPQALDAAAAARLKTYVEETLAQDPDRPFA